MKRTIALLALSAIIASTAAAAPSLYGTKGLVRTMSPDNGGPISFGAGFHVLGWLKGDGGWKYAQAYPCGNFALNDLLEFSLAPEYQYLRTDATAPSWYANHHNGLYDTRLGVKASFKPAETFLMGVYLGYDLPTRGLMDTILKARAPASHTGMFHAMLIPGLSLGSVAIDLNVGLAYDMDKDAVWNASSGAMEGRSRYPKIHVPFGLGFSYETEWVTPFLEVNGTYTPDTTKRGPDLKTRGMLNNNFYITPGLRVTMPFGLNLDAGFSYNLIDTARGMGAKGVPSNPDWQIVFGASYGVEREKAPKVPPTGNIAGTVKNKEGRPVTATVTAGGITATTDPATGAYTLVGISVTGAPVEIKAEAKGYVSKDGSVLLEKKHKKSPAPQDFTLELRPIPMGTIKGEIRDLLTGTGLDGQIVLTGPKPETVTIKGGAYNASLHVGNYSAAVRVPGYFEKTAAYAVAEKGIAVSSYMLLKVGAVMPVNAVWTSPSKATARDIPADAIVKAMIDNPAAKAEVKTVVDRVGSKKANLKLADQRALAVKAKIIAGGIDAARLTAMGEVPVNAGRSKADRAANTKVVVTITQ